MITACFVWLCKWMAQFSLLCILKQALQNTIRHTQIVRKLTKSLLWLSAVEEGTKDPVLRAP